MLPALFVLAMVGGVCGLAVISPRDVPPITGTCAFILTLAALGVAILR
ncbi:MULTISPECIES: hypothetical protein [unclassified Streptomyces]|nr:MULTISPECIES: hypothetical protein [unclassified Streptomyces]